MWGTPCRSSESRSQLVSPLNSTAHLHPGVGGRMRHPASQKWGQLWAQSQQQQAGDPGSPCLLRTRVSPGPGPPLGCCYRGPGSVKR